MFECVPFLLMYSLRAVAVGLEIQILVAVGRLTGVDAKLVLLVLDFVVCRQDALTRIVCSRCDQLRELLSRMCGEPRNEFRADLLASRTI